MTDDSLEERENVHERYLSFFNFFALKEKINLCRKNWDI